jgi:cell wall-associated NlpC family hydrolase
LGAIARRYGTTAAALASINHLADPNRIYPGQVLLLTGATATRPAPPAPPAPAPAPAVAPAPAPAPAPPVATVARGAAAAVQAALAQIGKPYVWGGAGPSAYDCSGLIRFAWSVAGVALPHNAAAQNGATRRVSGGALQAGDLVFYGSPEPYHVSMYVGNGQVVAADNSGTNVRVESISWVGQPMGYGRVG